ncbi:MAG: SsrA-binding protein SmpB [Minisyncoccia bacterium]
MGIILKNKKARWDYEIKETFDAGIQLLGLETKSIKNKKVNINDSYAVVHQGEIFLINMNIAPYQPNNTISNYNPNRPRKLLLTKSEIKHIIGMLTNKHLTLIPLEIYTKNRLIKIKLGLGIKRKKINKKEILKQRTVEKEIKRGMF